MVYQRNLGAWSWTNRRFQFQRQACDALHDHDVCGGFAKYIRCQIRTPSLGLRWVVSGCGEWWPCLRSSVSRQHLLTCQSRINPGLKLLRAGCFSGCESFIWSVNNHWYMQYKETGHLKTRSAYCVGKHITTVHVAEERTWRHLEVSRTPRPGLQLRCQLFFLRRNWGHEWWDEKVNPNHFNLMYPCPYAELSVWGKEIASMLKSPKWTSKGQEQKRYKRKQIKLVGRSWDLSSWWWGGGRRGRPHRRRPRRRRRWRRRWMMTTMRVMVVVMVVVVVFIRMFIHGPNGGG